MTLSILNCAPTSRLEGAINVSDSLSIIVPVQNAEATLRGQVEQLLELLPDLAPRFDVLIVDDGSSDHTVDLARALACEYPQVRLIRHEAPRGRWQALATGRNWAQGSRVLAVDELTPALRPTQVKERDLEPPATVSLPLPARSAAPVPPLNLPERLTAWGRGLPDAPQPATKAVAASRADEAHPAPPYRHHAAAFLEHLTRLALGE